MNNIIERLRGIFAPGPVLAMLCLLGTGMTVSADWKVREDASHVAFVSIKNEVLAEPHLFTRISGTVTDNGLLDIRIDLNSVDTLIAIRDQRMRDLLFRTATFPAAQISGKLDITAMTELAPGQSRVVPFALALNLNGTSRPLNVEAMVMRIGDGTWLATSHRPVIVRAGDFALLPGLQRLQEIAGLNAIAPTVPVTFVLVLDQQDDK